MLTKIYSKYLPQVPSTDERSFSNWVPYPRSCKRRQFLCQLYLFNYNGCT